MEALAPTGGTITSFATICKDVSHSILVRLKEFNVTGVVAILAATNDLGNYCLRRPIVTKWCPIIVPYLRSFQLPSGYITNSTFEEVD